MSSNTTWRPDVLGEGFACTTIELRPDSEGPVVATLVRHLPSEPATRAVLYVHGFNDYFFQREVAEWFVEQGWAFYALDLRKYGRSELPHQTRNMCRALSDYDEELDHAVEMITAAGHSKLLVAAHSAGGLITSLWLARRSDLPVSGLVLNSPFLEFKQSAVLRAALLPLTTAIAKLDRNRILPAGVSGLYGESIHHSRRGEWDFDLNWKPLKAPARVGWITAMAAGHRQVHAGLDLQVPTLVLASTRTVHVTEWHDDLMRGDVVLDADSIARWAPSLGRNVTLIRIPDAMHDVFLSSAPVRAEAFQVTERWIHAWAE